MVFDCLFHIIGVVLHLKQLFPILLLEIFHLVGVVDLNMTVVTFVVILAFTWASLVIHLSLWQVADALIHIVPGLVALILLLLPLLILPKVLVAALGVETRVLLLLILVDVWVASPLVVDFREHD